MDFVMDSKLNWERNTGERMKELNALYQRRNAIGKNWGLPPMVIRWIYLATVKLVITYGSVVCLSKAHKHKSFQRPILDKVQWIVSLSITGVRNSCPQDIFDLYVKRCMVRSVIRLRK